MKLLKIIVSCALIILCLVLWNNLSRKFYCLGKGECVTVWRTSNGCYVIPGKYFGLTKPTSNFIKTSEYEYLTIFFLEQKPNLIIVRNEGTSKGEVGSITVKNDPKGEYKIYNFDSVDRKLLYSPNAKEFKDVNKGVNYIEILDGYAEDKTGKRL